MGGGRRCKQIRNSMLYFLLNLKRSFYTDKIVFCVCFTHPFQMIKKNIDDEVLKKGHHDVKAQGGYVDNKQEGYG